MHVSSGATCLHCVEASLILKAHQNFNAHCKDDFSDYVQTHEEHDNSMATRTVGSIATHPTMGIFKEDTTSLVLTQVVE